jgi:hypothetical protein
MKKCSNCSAELKDDAKFCSECGEKTSSEGNISLEDVVVMQRNLKKDVNFDKPDEELTPEELANKHIYLALDKTVEEALGGEKKKEIDALISNEDFAGEIKDNLTKLIEVGKEIEKNLLLQKSFLTVFFDRTPENHFKVVVNAMADEAVGKNSLSNEERVEKAEQILKLVESYRGKMLKELISKQEVINALIPTFEKKIDAIDFERYEKEVDDSLNAIQRVSLRWLEITKELLPFRAKALEAVKEDLEIEEIVPNMVIKHKGDTTKTTSSMEIVTKGQRVLKLLKEASDAEDKVDKERTELSQWLFGKEEEYMDFLKKEERVDASSAKNNTNKGSGIKWTIVIVLSIVALSGGIWTAIGVFILGTIIINVLQNK